MIFFNPADNTESGNEVIIPYANSGTVSLTTNSSGTVTRTRLLGFGNISSEISVSENSFTLDGDSEFVIFPMPYKARVTTVNGRYSNVAKWSPGSNISLYIAVATAPAGSNIFTIHPQSKALADPYPQGPPSIPIRTIRTASKEGLDIVLDKGDYLAVMAGMENSGGNPTQILPFTFTGSIVIEKI